MARQLSEDDTGLDQISQALEEQRSSICADQPKIVADINSMKTDSSTNGVLADIIPPTELITNAIACMCGASISDPAFQTAVDLFMNFDSTTTPKAIYEAVTGVVVALMSPTFLCSADCKSTLEGALTWLTDLGFEQIEKAIDAKAMSMPTEVDKYANVVATQTPECICGIEYAELFNNMQAAGETFAAATKTTIESATGDGEFNFAVSIPAQVEATKAFLLVLLGEDGFVGSKGMCNGNCQALVSRLIKLELTHLLSIDFDALEKSAEGCVDDPESCLPVDLGSGTNILGTGRRLAPSATRDARARHALALLSAQGGWPSLHAEAGLVPRAMTPVRDGGEMRLLRGRRLAFSDYESVVESIGDDSVACACDYMDVEKMLGALDQIDSNFIDAVENAVRDDFDESTWYALSQQLGDLAKYVVDDFFMSPYGICNGKNGKGESYGCLKAQISAFELMGLVEEHALSGGIFTKANVLSKAPDPSLKDLFRSIPSCYCSAAVDYSNLIDSVLLGIALPDNYTRPFTETSPGTVVNGVMTVTGMCLADECKQMLGALLDTFLGVTTHSTADATCASDAVAKCSKDHDAANCPAAPAQASWLGSAVDSSDGKIDQSAYKAIYWTVCAVSQSCPPLGTSAYVLTSQILVALSDVDTDAKLNIVKGKFVNAINNKAGAIVLYLSQVTVTIKSRRRQLLARLLQAQATVEFEIETTSEQTKNIASDYLETTDAATLSSDLGVQTDATFTSVEVTAVVYPPPPPAPGSKEEVGGDGGGGCDRTCIIAVACGSVAGVLCCCVAVVALILVVKRKGKQNKTGSSTAAQGWSAGSGAGGSRPSGGKSGTTA